MLPPLIVDALAGAGIVACAVSAWDIVRDWLPEKATEPEAPYPPKACGSPFPTDSMIGCERAEKHQGHCRAGRFEWVFCRKCRTTFPLEAVVLIRGFGYACKDCVFIHELDGD